MRKIGLLLVIIFIGYSGFAAEYRSAGLAFLRVHPGTRITALGGAGTALQPGHADFSPSLNLLNPASRADSLSTTAQLAHSFWFADAGIEYLGLTFPAGEFHWGLFVTSANIGGFELRENRATDEPLGEFGAHYLHAGVSGNVMLRPSLSVGLRAAILYEKLYYHQAVGGSFSAGIQYRFSPRLSTGFALNHLGGMSKLREESTPLPSSVRIGAAFEQTIIPEQIDVVLLADAGYYFNDHSFAGGGLEVWLWDFIAARIGVNQSPDQLKTSFGAGIRWRQLRVDYGIWMDEHQLGTPHQFSVSLGL